MPCIDRPDPSGAPGASPAQRPRTPDADPCRRRIAAAALLAGSPALVLLSTSGCSLPQLAPRPTSRPVPAPGPAAPAAPAAPAQPSPAPSPAARPARSWDEYRIQAAHRLVQANAGRTYMSKPPEPLLAIPVLEIELAANGSIVSIHVQRRPRQALDTVQLAIDAVRRAAPFGPVGHLPRPWRFTEVFLFDDDRRFKPMSLD